MHIWSLVCSCRLVECSRTHIVTNTTVLSGPTTTHKSLLLQNPHLWGTSMGAQASSDTGYKDAHCIHNPLTCGNCVPTAIIHHLQRQTWTFAGNMMIWKQIRTICARCSVASITAPTPSRTLGKENKLCTWEKTTNEWQLYGIWTDWRLGRERTAHDPQYYSFFVSRNCE